VFVVVVVHKPNFGLNASLISCYKRECMCVSVCVCVCVCVQKQIKTLMFVCSNRHCVQNTLKNFYLDK